MSTYRVEFSIQRRIRDEEDFEEVGFGSTGSHKSIGDCEWEVGSMLQNRIWETTDGMPEPEEVYP